MGAGRITLEERLAGAVWGHLVGDAVGVPYEFTGPRDPAAVQFGATGTWGRPAGTWSDDGALMLALLDSLLGSDRGGRPSFDLDDQARRALAWECDGAYTPDHEGRFDIGNATAAALRRLREGVPAVDAGPADERSCGNGSLMRILPVALVGRDHSPARLIDEAHLASRVTHGHARCQVACAVYSIAVAGLLRGQEPGTALSWAFAETFRLYVEERGYEAHGVALEELRAWTGRGGSTFVPDAFWSAWDAFAGAAGYADSIRRAVAYGNDTDTTAAIAGGLAGARWGWGSIPVAWRRGMRGQDVARPLVDALVETTGARTTRSHPLRVDEVRLADAPRLASATGRLGITFLPGKKRNGWTGSHWRDLDLDMARLNELGWDALYLLNEDRELAFCLVPEIEAVLREAGSPVLVRLPIPDPQVPTDDRAYDATVGEIVARLRAGESVVVACRGGLDRSGMTASCVLVEAGMAPAQAMALVQASRRGAITKDDQRDYVRAWPHVS